MSTSPPAFRLSDTPSGGQNSSERERVHRQMLSVVSHDLKTPLASIIGSLEIYERVKDKLSEEKQKTLIGVALGEARKLDSFITNILEVTKLENDMIKPRRKTINIGSFLEDCMMRMSSHLPPNGAIDVVPFSGDPDVTTDPVLLNRAVGLVLDNAIKFGGTPPLIHLVFGRGENGQAFISIRDNGAGIPEAKLSTTISKYLQLSKEDQKPACTGLGLVLCQGIMTLLGGHLSVGNHPEGGAVFTLYFLAE